MSFDIDQVLKDMASAITGSIEENAGDIKEFAKTILESEKYSLKELADARRNGQIDDVVFEREIKREKKVVEAELLTVEIMTKVMAQKAVSAAMDVFIKAVKAVI